MRLLFLISILNQSRNTYGRVVTVHFTGDVRVKLQNGPRWTYNPECLIWISDGSDENQDSFDSRTAGGIKKGDRVRIKDLPIDEMRRLQKGHGGYNSQMALVNLYILTFLGYEGQVRFYDVLFDYNENVRDNGIIWTIFT